MRTTMPTVAAQVEQWRQEFGADYVNDRIRRGMRGEPGQFYAIESGHTIGTPAMATDLPTFSVQGYALLLGGDGAAFIRTPKEGAAHAAH